MNTNERAQALLTDEFFADVVEKQRLLYINNILNSTDDAVDFRERERLKFRGIEELLASLESLAADKQVAEKRWKIF